MGRLAASFFLAAAAATAFSLAFPLPEGQHRLPLAALSAVVAAVGVAVWRLPWERWPPAAMRWTIVPVALALIVAAFHFGGIDPYSYGVAYALVFVWIGLSQPRWTSVRFAVPAGAAYVLPLLAGNRPAGEVFTVAWILPVYVVIAEGCAWIASRLRTAEREVRAANVGIERLLETTVALGGAATETEAAQLTADLAADLLHADAAQVMVAEEPGSSRFVSRGQRNVSIPLGETVVDAAHEPTGTGLAVTGGKTVFIAEAESSSEVSAHLRHRVGAASMAFIPLPGEGGFLGAVVVIWNTPRKALDPFSQRAVEMLSAEAGRALERARATTRLTRDLGERGEAVVSLRREGELLRLLQAVTVAANEAATVEEAFQSALEEVCGYTGWPVGHVYRPDTGMLVSEPLWHLDDEARFRGFREIGGQTPVPVGAGGPGRVVGTGRPVWVADVTAEADFPLASAARDAGLGAALGIPVLVDGEVVAVLVFYSSSTLEPDASLLELAGHVGGQLARVVERRRAADALRASEEHTRAVIDTAGDAYIGMDSAGLITEWNRQAEVLLGWSRAEAVGRPMVDLILPEELRPAFRERLHGFLDTGESPILDRRVELSVLTRDGRRLPVEATAWATKVGSTYAFSAFLHDIFERKRLEEELTRQALHDPLTKLPNRMLFLDRLTHALARGERHPAPTTVLFLDLDGFKTVNDSLGHAAGDDLLVAVAERLGRSSRATDTVSRFGGDEFAILLEDTDADAGVLIAERVEATLATPFQLQGRQIFVRASIGVASAAGPGRRSAEDLLRDADLAMYMAKTRRTGGHAVFQPAMHAAALRRLELEADLRRAVTAGGFVLHYQPILRLHDRSLVGMEALIRWDRGGRGLVSPAEFVPLAEDTGLILDIGRWVLEEACRQAASWHGAYPLSPAADMSVNLSARQLQDPRLVDDVRHALEVPGFDAERLVVEITESMLMEEPDVAVDQLRGLRQLGVRLAVDDFGTGYSSLGQLRRFPVDELKIDRSFIAALTGGPEDAALAHAIVRLGHTLELRTVAEGIETAEQLRELQRLGCDYGQGYLFAPPLPRQAMSELLATARGGVCVVGPAPAAAGANEASAQGP